MLGHSQYISTLYSTVLLVNSTTGEARTVQFVNMLILCSMPMPKNLHSSTELALCSPYYFQCAVDYFMWYAETATFVPWQLTVQETASHEVPSDLNWVFSFKAIEAVFKACCTVYWTNAYHRDTATQATTSLSPFFTLYTRQPRIPWTPYCSIALITQSEHLLLMLLSTQDNVLNWPDHRKMKSVRSHTTWWQHASFYLSTELTHQAVTAIKFS